MPRSVGQKLKLLCLEKYLLENSDEEHPVSMSDITEHLSGCGVKAERKSLYDDLEQLRLFGDDIVTVKGKTGTGYYIAERDFQISELKLLVDAVQGSKFITHKKSDELIKKLENLCSRYQAAALQRQVLVTNRIKTMNESIYYNVDKIHTAIGADRRITFQYFEYNCEKARIYRHGGALYSVSPFALNWDDENYYLIAYDSSSGILKHYRVDKMIGIEITELPRDGAEEFGKLDIAVYTKKVFSMFGGEEKNVCLEFSNRLAGAVIDRFGKNVVTRKSEHENRFYVYTSVIVSPHFFGWVFSFGDGARIVSPSDVTESFADYARKVLSAYS